ncbi:hypothetical protein [Nocardioides ferulae]|uniref:hypothetical protein n=1 Tax=Nocardioides ferulae TaxID=2340821 RepID=UPI000EB32090|nr:hypothetical protein [Nocardioides ferulae]
MTNSNEEPERAISDEQLPEDLRPGDDNPLAEGLPPGETADLDGGKIADEMEAERSSDDEPEDEQGDGAS